MSGRRPRLPTAVLRELLAQEAARLIVECGIDDFGLAKRKAAERLGARSAGALPNNVQIQASVAERQRIFEPTAHPRRVASLRRLAAEIMESLEAFRPWLAGPVLAGTATANSPIELHVFTDSPEDVAHALRALGIAFGDCQRRYRFKAGEPTTPVPGFAFVEDGESVVILAFPERRARHAPLSPVDRRPMKRARRARVLALL